MKRDRALGVALLVLGSALPGCRKAPTADADPSVTGKSSAPPPLDTSWEQNPGRLLAPKERAPDFEGIAHTGMRVRLSSFSGKTVVVFFYGADKTPEATAEVRAFRDAWMRFIPLRTMVIGVSADDRVMHRDFATAEELPFLLVTDEGGKIARAFGVPSDGGRSRPATFVVSPEGVVLRVISAPNPSAYATEILDALSPPAR
ncbi:MAG TPA: peroxiredoxin [Polyangiaceae bacterium]|nr:peroxiredoxin [Polyangiaceae bacterium]